MSVFTYVSVSDSPESFEVGKTLAQDIQNHFGDEPINSLLIYATMNHNHEELLRGIREYMPSGIPIVGCSTQGVMARDIVREDGYVAGAMGFGGSALQTKVGYVESIEQDTKQKGIALGKQLNTGTLEPPKAVVLLYDPLIGTDMDEFMGGLFEEVQCPIIGGGAGHPFGPFIETFQYFGDKVMGHAAVALALRGDFEVDHAFCHGTTPVGIVSEVTKSDGTTLLELDGRPALEVFQEVTAAGAPNTDPGSSLALGILMGNDEDSYYVRAAFGIDKERGGVILQSHLAEGAEVMLHHRTIDGVLKGTEAMTEQLQGALTSKTPRAILGFECGARTKPFLGERATLDENQQFQRQFADDVQWLGMLAWGELFPIEGKPAFHNYIYPVLVLSQ